MNPITSTGFTKVGLGNFSRVIINPTNENIIDKLPYNADLFTINLMNSNELVHYCNLLFLMSKFGSCPNQN